MFRHVNDADDDEMITKKMVTAKPRDNIATQTGNKVVKSR